MKVMPFNQRRTVTDNLIHIVICIIVLLTAIQKHDRARYEYGDNIVKGTNQLAQKMQVPISFNAHCSIHARFRESGLDGLSLSLPNTKMTLTRLYVMLPSRHVVITV